MSKSHRYSGPTCDDLIRLSLSTVDPTVVYGGGGGNTTITLAGIRFSEAHRLERVAAGVDGEGAETAFRSVTVPPAEAQRSDALPLELLTFVAPGSNATGFQRFVLYGIYDRHTGPE